MVLQVNFTVAGVEVSSAAYDTSEHVSATAIYNIGVDTSIGSMSSPLFVCSATPRMSTRA